MHACTPPGCCGSSCVFTQKENKKVAGWVAITTATATLKIRESKMHGKNRTALHMCGTYPAAKQGVSPEKQRSQHSKPAILTGNNREVTKLNPRLPQENTKLHTTSSIKHRQTTKTHHPSNIQTSKQNSSSPPYHPQSILPQQRKANSRICTMQGTLN